jgi:putative ABC transport system permease protein
MTKNYFKIAWRSLRKHTTYTAINIIGLTIGLGCCLMIALYVQDELSYDKYHKNSDQIYRVIHGNAEDGKPKDAKSHDYRFQVWGNAPVGAALKADFPEVKEVIQFSGRSTILLKNGENVFQEENVFFADSNTLKVFSWPLVAGDPGTALLAPYSAVLTETTAKKYFGNENPIGKILQGGGTGGRASEGVYKVTGVMKDVPSNSHFTFDALMSMSSFKQSWAEVFDEWGYVDFYTYFLTVPHTDIRKLTAKVPDFLTRHNATREGRYTIAFEPLNDAYLHSSAERQPGTTGNLSSIYLFTIIGLFILCIACVNFMNLATARSMERAKEVGVRKVAGANRKELINQFFSESLLMVFLSAILAIILVIAALPLMQAFTGKDFQFGDIINTRSILIYSVTVVITGILAGIYPAIILSGFKPITVLKGSFKTSSKGVNLRRGLVILQFSLSISLIVGTIIVFRQLNFMQHKSMGFKSEQMLVIDFNYDEKVISQIEAIKNIFLKQPGVTSVSASRSVPGSYFPNAGTEIQSSNGGTKQEAPALFEVDVDFIKHFGLQMAAGRAYSRDFPADTARSLIINEAAAKLFGYADPQKIIGKHFQQWGREGQVIGVVKDFNYLSLHRKIEPLALRLEPLSSRYFTLKVKPENIQATIGALKNVWTNVAPQRPFLYNFLDESFSRQYDADIRFRGLFTFFSGFAVLIACLGLLGLATYTAQQRTKEIGVRKVLGASTGSIVQLLSKDFVKLVCAAIIIATPLAWWAMNKWLQDFAFRIEIKWWMFLLAGVVALIIALLTISFQAIRAAVANPVKSLRTE